MNTTEKVPVRSPALSRVYFAVFGAVMMVAVLTGLYVWQDRRETVARAEERAMSLATVTEAYVLRRLRETESGMKTIAEMRSGQSASADAIQTIAELHRHTFPFIEALGVIEDGRADLVAGDPLAATALINWASAQSRETGKLRVGRPLWPSPQGDPLIPLWLRSPGVNSGRASIVVAAIRSDMLSLMHTALRLDADKLSAIVDTQGTVMAREPYVRNAIGTDISGSDTFADVPADRKSAVRLLVSPVDGTRYLLGMSRLKEFGLSVRAGEKWDAAMESWRERTERSVAIAVIFIVVIALLGRLAAHRVRDEARARQARSVSDGLHRLALESLAEGVITNGLDGSILAYNAAALRILGLTGEQLLGLTPLDPRWRSRRADGSDFPGSEHPVMRVLATGQPQFGVPMNVETGDGTRRWIEINAVPTHVDGVLSGAVVSFADVTAHRAMLDQLETLNHTLEARVAERTAQLRQLGGELAEVEDRERRQISRDLHDDIAQTLAVARIRLAGLALESGDQTRTIARAVGDLIDRADASIRSLAAQLAPPALAEIGLVAGLEWLADEMDRLYGLKVEVDDDGAPKPLAQGPRTVLFRAVRELLINVSKHAGVARAIVSCRREGRRIVIEVEDAGVGYDPRSAIAGGASGLGLRSIRERLAHIGGRLEFAAAPDGGTRATIVAPLADVASPVTEATT